MNTQHTIRERLDETQADAERYGALVEDYKRKAREAREPFEARIQDLIEEADKAAAGFEYEADGAKMKLKDALARLRDHGAGGE